MNNTVAIAGLGWLGKPLAQKLMTLGYRIKGSVTSLDKATMLQKNGFDAYKVEISESGLNGEVKAFLSETDYLIIMIPPGLRRNTGANYALKMSHFLTEIEKASVEKVILVSSTSVYDDLQGKVTESILPRPSSEAGKQLAEVERLFFNSVKLNCSIVRFGGLFGGTRQPARYLAGRENLNNGKAPVNLIHREDCIGILSEIIKQDAFGFIFNAVLPDHPSKSDYYIKKTKELGLTPPTYTSDEEETSFKQVDSDNISTILGYQFKKGL